MWKNVRIWEANRDIKREPVYLVKIIESISNSNHQNCSFSESVNNLLSGKQNFLKECWDFCVISSYEKLVL